MKKCLTVLAFAFILLGASVSLYACGNKKHEHVCSQWSTVVPATCTSEGSNTGICDKCGKEFTVVTEKLPHDYEWITSVDATCQHEGLMEGECKACGHNESKILPIAPHSPTTILGYEATCEQAGLSDGSRCSVCDEWIVEQKTIAAKGHKMEENWEVLDAPDCTTTGEKIRHCENCNHFETEIIPATGHTWNNWEKDDTVEGQHKHECSVCGEVEKKACIYADEENVAATCTEGAYTKKTCPDCHDEIRSYTSEKLGHSMSGWIEMIVEDEQSDGHVHKHRQYCTRCLGEEQEQECNLVFQEKVEATCTTAEYDKMVCQDCGSVHEKVNKDKPALGHKLEFEQEKTSPVSGRHKQVCKNEGCDYETAYDNCTVIQTITKKATCEEDSKSTYQCSVCNKVLIEISNAGTKLGHKWSKYSFVGTEQDRKHERHCEREECDQVEQEACNKVSVEQAPTCTQDGSIKETCDKCFTSFVLGGKHSVGHTWGKWEKVSDDEHKHECSVCHTVATAPHTTTKDISPADCTTPEITTTTCNECEFEKVEQTQDALGHKWEAEAIYENTHKIKCATCSAEHDGEHDFSESNLCSGCQYDGLTYRLEGVHCVLEKDDNVPNAKHIVIPQKHKVLNGEGGYAADEYTVQTIGKSAFYGNYNIVTIVIPTTVTKIEKYAFNNCLRLQHFDIEDGDESQLETIEDLAFMFCGALTTFDAPKSLKTIGDYAFEHCTSLVNITLGDHVEHVGNSAFLNTGFVNDGEHWVDDMLYIGKHLIKARNSQVDGQVTNKSVMVKDETISIASHAFENCVELESLVLPKSLKTVDASAFEKCKNITSVEFKGDLQEWLAIKFENDTASPLWHGTTGLHIQNAHDDIDLSDTQISKIPAGTFRNTSIKSIILPSTITYIGEDAFEDCASLLTITIPDDAKIQFVGKNAFKGCGYYNLASNWDENGVLYIGKLLIEAKTSLSGHYDVKNGTIAIGDYAFAGSQISSIKINKDCIRVGSHAFDDCNSMSAVTFEDNTYDWYVTQEGKISRVLGAATLGWGELKLYDGGWTRRGKTPIKQG